MFDKEFKEAISHLPSKEKDKLILRLLKKDLVLANQLSFKLLDERTVDDRRQEVEKRLISLVERLTRNYYSPGYLNMDMRDISGIINEHVTITKDKYGEPSLHLLMLNEVLKFNNEILASSTYGKAYKCCIYIIARVF